MDPANLRPRVYENLATAGTGGSELQVCRAPARERLKFVSLKQRFLFDSFLF